jgi:hypothetical protein
MPKDFLTVNPVAAKKLAMDSSRPSVVKSTNMVAMVARSIAPGTMGRHIRVAISPAGGGLGMIISEHPATTYVLYGTKPHVIIAKKGKYLKFNVGGDDIFRHKVNHPGTKANNFLLKALEACKV